MIWTAAVDRATGTRAARTAEARPAGPCRLPDRRAAEGAEAGVGAGKRRAAAATIHQRSGRAGALVVGLATLGAGALAGTIGQGEAVASAGAVGWTTQGLSLTRIPPPRPPSRL